MGRQHLTLKTPSKPSSLVLDSKEAIWYTGIRYRHVFWLVDLWSTFSETKFTLRWHSWCYSECISTTVGIEPITFGILVQCSANWATRPSPVRVCGISELSLVPSIPMCAMIMIFFVFFFMLCIFFMLPWVYIHTGQAENLAWPWWESNPQPLGY